MRETAYSCVCSRTDRFRSSHLLFEFTAVAAVHSEHSEIRRHIIKHSTKDQAGGKFHTVIGEVKEIAGKLIDDPELEAEGAGEKIAGKAQKKISQVEKVVGK